MHTHRFALVAGFVVSLAHGTAGLADQVTLEPMKDNTLYEDPNGGASNGVGERIFVGNNAGGSARRAALAFDIAGSIPAGSTIDSVTLTLNMSMTRTGATDVGLHVLEADWGEGASNALGEEGGGAPPEPGDATWIHTFFPTDFWTTPGGDFSATTSATTSVGGTGQYSWGSTAIMLEDVQDWLDQPATNFGWVAIGNEQFQMTAKRFDSRENPTAANRPKLTIDFTPATGSQPATLTDVTRTLGIFISGGVPEVLASDDLYYVLQSGPGFNPAEPHPARVDVGFDTGGFAAVTLDVTVEEKANIGGPTAVVLMRNFTTGQFVEMGRFGVSPSDQTFDIPGIAAGDYISGANRIEVRVRTFAVLILNPTVRGFFSHDFVGVQMNG